MSTALIIALMAVAISLFTVFIALRAANQAKEKAKGDSGSATTSSSDGPDCGPSDGGSCDGGGGGD